MKITILTRYPRVDTAAWKIELASRLHEAGTKLTIIYTRSALVDQLRAGLKEFGFGAWQKYRDARRARAMPSSSKLEAETLSQWAARRGVPVHRYRSIAESKCLAKLREIAPDLLLLAGADIVPKLILDVPRLGALNPHYALLPRYRGMNVAEWSIYHDDPVGVSIHFVDPGIDTGDIIHRAYVPVEPGDTLATIRAKQQRLSMELLLEAAKAIEAGGVVRVRQEVAGGKQYYRMHPLLRREVERKLESGGYRWSGVLPDEEALNGG